MVPPLTSRLRSCVCAMTSGAHLGERLVAVGMIVVIVRVDDEAGRLPGAQALEGGTDAIGQGPELSIHQQHTVHPGEGGDVAAGAAQQIQAGTERGALDLNPAQVLLLRAHVAGNARQQHGADARRHSHAALRKNRVSGGC